MLPPTLTILPALPSPSFLGSLISPLIAVHLVSLQSLISPLIDSCAFGEFAALPSPVGPDKHLTL